MQKLVITYNSNSYEYSEEFNVCVMYHSPEAFIVDFEKEIMDNYENYEKNKDLWKEYYSKLNDPNYKSTAKEPNCNMNYINFADKVWMIDDFMVNKVFECPSVRTLNEWFDEKLRETNSW